jgi:hypothetical protein
LTPCRGALGDVELRNPVKFASPAAQNACDRVEDGIDSLASCLLAAEPLIVGESVQELSFGHVESSSEPLKWRPL